MSMRDHGWKTLAAGAVLSFAAGAVEAEVIAHFDFEDAVQSDANTPGDTSDDTVSVTDSTTPASNATSTAGATLVDFNGSQGVRLDGDVFDFGLGTDDELARDYADGLKITLRLQLDGFSSGNDEIIQRWDTTGGADNRAFLLYAREGTLRFSISSDGNSGDTSAGVIVNNIAANTEYDIVAIFDPGKEVKLSVDGGVTFQTVATEIEKLFNPADVPFVIGNASTRVMVDDITISALPEPASVGLLGVGGALMALRRGH